MCILSLIGKKREWKSELDKMNILSMKYFPLELYFHFLTIKQQVEDFWKMYNHTYSTTELISNTDYLLFKKGIRPEWEDPHNN